jgi:hypothetical protein
MAVAMALAIALTLALRGRCDGGGSYDDLGPDLDLGKAAAV